MKSLGAIVKSNMVKQLNLNEIYLGQSLTDFIRDCVTPELLYEKRIITMEAYIPWHVAYFFTPEIRILFNLKLSSLVEIRFTENSDVVYKKDIKIGSKVSPLLEVGKSIAYEDDYIFLDNDDSVMLVVDEDIDTLKNKDKIGDLKLEQLIIRKSL